MKNAVKIAKWLKKVAENIDFKVQIKKGNEGKYLLKWEINHHQM